MSEQTPPPLTALQHYSLMIEPDDSAYMELDPDGRYVLFEEVESLWAAVERNILDTTPAAGLDAEPVMEHVHNGKWCEACLRYGPRSAARLGAPE